MNLDGIVDPSDAAAFKRTGHFVYEPGHHGDTWLALDRLFLDQRRLSAIAGLLADRLGPHEPEVICGPLIGGALLGQWVAHDLDLPFVYAERVPPSKTSPARYRIPEDLTHVIGCKRVAVVDDAINAGAATLAAVAEIARLGGQVPVAAAIFVRSPGGVELLGRHGVAVEHLVSVAFTIWEAVDCPLCAAGIPIAT